MPKQQGPGNVSRVRKTFSNLSIYSWRQLKQKRWLFLVFCQKGYRKAVVSWCIILRFVILVHICMYLEYLSWSIDLEINSLGCFWNILQWDFYTCDTIWVHERTKQGISSNWKSPLAPTDDLAIGSFFWCWLMAIMFSSSLCAASNVSWQHRPEPWKRPPVGVRLEKHRRNDTQHGENLGGSGHKVTAAWFVRLVRLWSLNFQVATSTWRQIVMRLSAWRLACARTQKLMWVQTQNLCTSCI